MTWKTHNILFTAEVQFTGTLQFYYRVLSWVKCSTYQRKWFGEIVAQWAVCLAKMRMRAWKKVGPKTLSLIQAQMVLINVGAGFELLEKRQWKRRERWSSNGTKQEWAQEGLLPIPTTKVEDNDECCLETPIWRHQNRLFMTHFSGDPKD